MVTGLRSEMRCLPRGMVEVFVSGASACRARAGAEQLAAAGVTGLLSFGLAGGLAPELGAGDLLIPNAVMAPAGERIPTDPVWRSRVKTVVERSGLEVQDGALAGSDRLVTTPAAKQQLFDATGALGIDMESHAVGAVAREVGCPFLVVRAIADPADQALPLSAAQALTPDGRIWLPALANPLFRRPAEILVLLRLGRQSAAALRTLRRVVLLAGPALGLA